MSKILMGIIAALGIASYFLYIQNENLKQDLLVAEVKFQETENKYNVMREDFEKQGRALQNLQRENNVIEQEKQRYRSQLLAWENRVRSNVLRRAIAAART